jgi:hypothetical protein
MGRGSDKRGASMAMYKVTTELAIGHSAHPERARQGENQNETSTSQNHKVEESVPGVSTVDHYSIIHQLSYLPRPDIKDFREFIVHILPGTPNFTDSHSLTYAILVPKLAAHFLTP